MRRYANIHKHAIDTVNAKLVQYRTDISKIVMYKSDLVQMIFQPLFCSRMGIEILIDTDQSAGGDPLCDFQRMTAAASGTVYINTVRSNTKSVDTFLQQNGNMMKFQ